ncbi:unnamed protein product [Linum trigynum]|uniref:Uncharacterized protein n=1 Tax=Linum trigynum TaxID=586398 RepID=A0AAV2CXK1_9ROSI
MTVILLRNRSRSCNRWLKALQSVGFKAVPVVIGRQLSGGAEDSLAPPLLPPQSPTTVAESSPSPPAPQGLAGVRKDLAEIKGSLKVGLSLLSGTRTFVGRKCQPRTSVASLEDQPCRMKLGCQLALGR